MSKLSSDKMSLLKSVQTIDIHGFNQMRIINSLNNEGVALTNVIKKSPKLLSITINKKDSLKALALLKNMCYNYEIVDEGGIKKIAKSMLNRVGLLAGVVVFGAIAVFLSMMVWRVEIQGNEIVDALIIERHLYMVGIRSGVFRGSMDIEAAVDALRDLDGIAEGTIEVRGTVVFINVMEEEVFVVPEIPLLPSDLVSEFDARVTRVVLESGTARVGVGDIVARDEVLIGREILDLEGEVLDEVRARGRVYGEVAFSVQHVFSEVEVYAFDTGERESFSRLSLFGIGVGRGTCDSVRGWQRTTRTERFFFIPIRVTQNNYANIVMRERQRDVEAHIDSLIRAAVLDNIIKAGGSEVEVVHTITRIENGLIMLNIHLIGEVLIARAD